jgi:hypothetical protein
MDIMGVNMLLYRQLGAFNLNQKLIDPEGFGTLINHKLEYG